MTRCTRAHVLSTARAAVPVHPELAAGIRAARKAAAGNGLSPRSRQRSRPTAILPIGAPS